MRFGLIVCALVGTSVAAQARAEQISYFTDELSTGNATELGRASRSVANPTVFQTWTGQESYPGQVNLATTYFYNTYDFAASDFAGAPYVEVSVYDELDNRDFFVSAYGGSYDPSNRAANWLGDAGQSGNLDFFAGVPGDPRYFDVVLPAGEDLVLLVNSTLGGTNGLLQPYDIDVAAYADTQYNDPAPTPEPGTLLLTASGLLGTVGVMRRRVMGRG